MRHIKLSCLLALLVLVFVLNSACGRDDDAVHMSENDPLANLHFATPTEIQEQRVRPNSYLVAFRNLVDEQQPFAGYQRRALAHFAALSQPWAQASRLKNLRYFATLNLSHLSRSFSNKRLIEPAPWLKQEPPIEERMASLVEVKFRSEGEARATLSRWYSDKRIWYAEPNYIQELKGELEDQLVEAFGGANSSVAPWLEQIKFAEAIQEIGKIDNPASPLVVVMDSGVDVEHPNLREAVYVNERGENKLQCRDDRYGCNTTASNKDELGNGSVFPTGTTGFNQTCPYELGDAASQCEHGTHVAGIIAARGADRFTGVCPYCKILVVRVVENDAGRFAISDASIIAGLSYISGFQLGGQPLARIINASYGKFESTRSVELFISALKKFGRGTLMIAAAGNEDSNRRQYPAAFDDVIAVSNVIAEVDYPQKSESSNFGMWVDVAAPGDWNGCISANSRFGGILSTVPGGEAGCKIGTSMSTPMVAGVAGLVLAKQPELTAVELEERLKASANPELLYGQDVNGGYRPLVNGKLVPLLGTGLINALTAVSPELDAVPTLDVNRPNRIKPGCGVVGGPSGAGSLWFWLSLPGLIALLRFCKTR